ncbi:CYFA0S24e01706g1_1 [Cyberlindnera fabianii]|uniref:CYFA0S24e01706g1_1 n=1 Tax=Cyberlindnera fabianii TaxID=36022 RepID=A0A061B9M2_CYBFA|nr:CYFA0S24e01706g1_1 [Cyberlindnera fabianii]
MSDEFVPRERDEFRVQRRFIKSPDTKARDEIVSKTQAEIKQKDMQLAEITAQLNKAVTDPKVAAERKTLIAELGELKKTQADLKTKRNTVNSKIKEIDSSLKRKISEIQNVTSKYSFKSVDDIDNKIKRSEDEIASGDLALVEERRLVKEISSLRKLRKDFASLDAQQKSIDNDKQKIADLKKELSTFNSKEVSAKFEEVQKKLDELSLSNKSVNDKRTSLIQKRSALFKEKDALYATLKKTREEFDQQFKAFKKAMADEKKRVAEEEKKLRADKAKSERKSKLEKELAEASKPAFEEEIDSIHTLLAFFDPTYVKPSKTIEFNKSTFVSERKGRVISLDDDFEIIKKPDNVFIAGSKTNGAGKKNKKASKAKFTMEPEVISQLGDLDIALPTSREDTPKTIESLKAKLEEYTASQEATTKKNIEAAKAKIAKMEADWAKQDAKEAEAAAAAAAKAEGESTEAAKETADQE